MRVANLDGRLVIVTGEAGHEIGYDVEKSSGGRFSADPQAVYDQWTEFAAWAAGADLAGAAPFAAADLGAPAPAPRQVLAIGLNYAEHAAESGFDVPEEPTVMFTKWQSCLTGPVTEVELPDGGHTDWEVELVVVIGRRAFRISADQAWGHVAGLTRGPGPLRTDPAVPRALPAVQSGEVAARLRARPARGWSRLDELADPNDLELGCSVNGNEMQKGRTSDLIFSVPAHARRAVASGCRSCQATSCSPARPPGSGSAARRPPGSPPATSWSATSPASVNCASASSPRPVPEERLSIMALHRLTQIVMGVPNVEQTAGYYTEFGPLLPPRTGTFATVDGGEQLRITTSGHASARPARRRCRRPGRPRPRRGIAGRARHPGRAHRGRGTRRRSRHRGHRAGRDRRPLSAGTHPGAGVQRPGCHRQVRRSALPASCATSRSARASSGTWCSARPTSSSRRSSSTDGSASR